MKNRLQALDKGWIATLTALLLPLAAAAVLVPFRSNFALLASALLLVLVVVVRLRSGAGSPVSWPRCLRRLGSTSSSPSLTRPSTSPTGPISRPRSPCW